MKLPAEEVLIRWINYHLGREGIDRCVIKPEPVPRRSLTYNRANLNSICVLLLLQPPTPSCVRLIVQPRIQPGRRCEGRRPLHTPTAQHRRQQGQRAERDGAGA